jgi:hypothetical protein
MYFINLRTFAGINPLKHSVYPNFHWLHQYPLYLYPVSDCRYEQQLFLEIRNIKYLVFVIKIQYVLFEVGSESLNSVQTDFRPKRDKKREK